MSTKSASPGDGERESRGRKGERSEWRLETTPRVVNGEGTLRKISI
jgi:hypothetical protein